MKRFLVFKLLPMLVIAAYFKGVEGDAQQMVRDMAQRCKEREGASDSDVDGLMTLNMPITRVQKCFNDCIQQQVQISDGRSFNKEGFLKHSRAIVGESPEKQQVAREIADACEGTSNDDNCELAADIIGCIRREMGKRQG